MADFKSIKPILDKIPFPVLLVLYLGNLGWEYYNFQNSPDSPAAMKQQEIEASKAELERLKDRVRKADAFLRSLDVKKAELRKLAQDLDSTKAVISEDLDVPALIRTVLTEAKKVGLSVTSLRPTVSKNSEFYTEQAFDLQFKGVYFQLVGFLDRVSNLQKIVRVDSITMQRVSASTARYVEVSGTIELKAYKYNRSKADDIHKTGVAATLTSGGGQ